MTPTPKKSEEKTQTTLFTFPSPKPEKPKFTQVFNTEVSNTEARARSLIDVNVVVAVECEQYAGKRKRCDEKDPSGVICGFKPNCAIRLARYKTKPK